ncbi:hypothetical protein ES332_D12G036800v1 [Gossypium tomentosum]|uniref:Phosphatidylinositol-specific phospholipase C X domain-containing protein n=1 Tax=Gossypium tomentosum TaxID=34277 RepID=A0A5D2I4S0_GOSTO|nr:hypothetical protein ES332_D12G036800v1 [Gossypium tomentosum]
MGSEVSKQIQRRKAVSMEKQMLFDLNENCGETFPGCDYRPTDRKNWMASLGPKDLHINNIVWPGTHNSATDRIGIPCISRPFAQCQTLSVYQQLALGTRKFLFKTTSEVIILEIRTEYGHRDPPEFEDYLEEKLSMYLIHQDDYVFGKTIAELLPKRIICVWKPRNSPQPKPGSPFCSAEYLKDNWIDTDLPSTKFDSNLKYLSDQAPVSSRYFFYRVENTVTAQPDNPVVCVRPVTGRIHGYARLFINRCFAEGCANRLQVFSTDFIGEDFVDACVGLTHARVHGEC